MMPVVLEEFGSKLEARCCFCSSCAQQSCLAESCLLQTCCHLVHTLMPLIV